MTDQNAHKPAYTQQDIKDRLLNAGASGTVYSLVMPESEANLSTVIDGLQNQADGVTQQQIIEDAIKWALYEGASPKASFESVAALAAQALQKSRKDNFFDMYHEPWTSKQDAMHEEYFDTWLAWSAPVVNLNEQDFPHRYPTSGGSEGIVKLMAEYMAEYKANFQGDANTAQPTIHVFEGEYEGFRAFADSLGINVVQHDRADWKNVAHKIGAHDQVWISQPSAIDGMVWPHFEDFASELHRAEPRAELIPDLTYVGSVARDFAVNVDFPNIPSVIMSQSKPMGGYYHRAGGVLSRTPKPTLFGNKWFKNLQSIAWATQMMKTYGVYDLPRKYRDYQEEASARAGRLLGIKGLEAADVSLLATAPSANLTQEWQKTLLRGSKSEQVLRICVTPGMTVLIDPKMAPQTTPKLYQAWKDAGIVPKDATPNDPAQSGFRMRSRISGVKRGLWLKR